MTGTTCAATDGATATGTICSVVADCEDEPPPEAFWVVPFAFEDEAGAEAALAWDTSPSSPGLAIRTGTSALTGTTCGAAETAAAIGATCAVVADCEDEPPPLP